MTSALPPSLPGPHFVPPCLNASVPRFSIAIETSGRQGSIATVADGQVLAICYRRNRALAAGGFDGDGEARHGGIEARRHEVGTRERGRKCGCHDLHSFPCRLLSPLRASVPSCLGP